MEVTEWEAALEMGEAPDTAGARTFPNWKVADLILLARTDALTTAQAETAALEAELGERIQELAALRAEVERLQKALEQIAQRDGDGFHMHTPQAMEFIARAALTERQP